ncbi:MAG TPA: hypothetical protein G4O03_01205 [Dehalococcoidia bacterium]|nr:hypothetical protein [Dehalococcoidia bacterium]
MKLQEYLDILRRKYEPYFDVYLDHPILSRRLDLYARSHVRSEKFFLTKKVTLGAWETNEHCLVEGHPAKIYPSQLQDFTEFLVRAAGELVKPHAEHMSSLVTGVLVAERGFDPEAIRIGTRFKHSRSFRFGLCGWYSICLLLVDLSSGQVYASPNGREVMKSYQPKPVSQESRECFVSKF